MTRTAAALALLLAIAAPANAETSPPDTDGAAARESLAALQRDDARLLAIGWRLTTGNAAYCEGTRPAIGLLLQDMAGYADPATMRAVAGIAGDFAVQAVAPDSPAAYAGLRPNGEVESIDGTALAGLPAGEAPDWRRLVQVHAMIERSLAEDGNVAVEGPAGSIKLAGTPACPGRFEVTEGDRAVADGTRVVIGRDFAGFDRPDDELAAAVAHELAHNLLAHRAWLDPHGRKRRDIRVTEQEADRLSPWLLANAGYPPDAALRFMRAWGPRHGGGLLRKRTHAGWDERAETIAAEIARVEAARGDDGSADWSRHFVREIAP